MNTIAIIIPVYCKTQESLYWLEECIDSALLQQTKEIILVNDDSPMSVDEFLFI